MKRKFWLITMIGTMVFGLLWQSMAAAASGEVRLGISRDENALNPYTYVTGSPGLDLVGLVYDSLFILDTDNQPVPWLVDQFSVEDDGKKITMKLHDKITWHDGKPLTSEDVKFTYEYIFQYPKSRFTNPSKVISSIDIPDSSTVIFTLSESAPDFFIQPLADLPILPKHVWSEITDPNTSMEQMGSGPFILNEYKPGQHYSFRANEHYFKGKPLVETLILPIINDSTALFTALRAGQLDVVSSSVPPELAAEFESDSSLKVMKGAGLSTTLIQFNASKFPLTEKAVREAISLSINPTELVDTIMLGYATAGSPGFIHPSSTYANKALIHQTNLEQAKKVLDDAGFKDVNQDGFREDLEGKPIKLMVLVYADSPARVRTAEIVTEAMKSVGLNVVVKTLDSTTVDALVWPDFDVQKGRDFDMSIWSWSSSMQLFPARLTELFYSNLAIGSMNIGAFQSEAFDQLADQLRTTTEGTMRLDLIHQMQQQISQDYPVVPLYYEQITNVYRPEAHDHWVFQDGKGIIHKLSFLLAGVGETSISESQEAQQQEQQEGELAQAESDRGIADSAPLQSENSASGKGSQTLIWLGLVIVIVVISLSLISRKRRKN